MSATRCASRRTSAASQFDRGSGSIAIGHQLQFSVNGLVSPIFDWTAVTTYGDAEHAEIRAELAEKERRRSGPFPMRMRPALPVATSFVSFVANFFQCGRPVSLRQGYGG